MKDVKWRKQIEQTLNAELSGLSTSSLQRDRLYHNAIGGERMKKKGNIRVPSRIAAIVTLIMIALATTASALTRPAVLNWLLGNNPASSQLESTTQTVIGENAADGVTVRMTSVVYDGENLAFSYELENDHSTMPVLVAADPTVRIDGKEASMWYCTADPYSPQMVPSPHLDVLPVKRNPAVGGGIIGIGEVAKDNVTCEMTFVVYKPENKFAIMLLPDSMQANVESYTSDARAEAEDSLNTLKSFQNAFFAEEIDLANDQWLAAGYTVIHENGMLYDLPENSHLNEVSKIKVTFEFDASMAFSCDFAETDDIALADATLHIERFRLSSLETRIDLWLIPQENTKEAARDLAEKYGAYTLVDEQGEAVQYSEMDHMADITPYVTQMNGQWVCRYRSKMPGLLQFPESVGFTAGDEELIRFDLMIVE